MVSPVSPERKHFFGSRLLASRSPRTYAEQVILSCVEAALDEFATGFERLPWIKPEPEDDSSPETPNRDPSTEIDELLEHLGLWLQRQARTCCQIAINLSRGPHIEKVVHETHQRSWEDSDMADLSSVSHRDVELSKLRKVRDLSVQYARDVQAVYEPAVKPLEPTPSNVHSPLGGGKQVRRHSVGDVQKDKQPRKTARLRQRTPEDPDSGNSTDDAFDSINMAALRQRGKGDYYCPKGKRCQKGGVDKNGKVVNFKRNSSFVQHCNKHNKPYKCEMSGCPNPPRKRRFARRDGLDRHMTTVVHAEVETP